MDFFVSPTPLNAFVYRGAHVPPCSHGADAMGARGFPQSTEDRRRSGQFGLSPPVFYAAYQSTQKSSAM